MKKLILPALFGMLILTSCKKDYTCECTRTSVNSNGSDVSTSKTQFKDVKKKFMTDKAECFSTEYTYDEQEFMGFDPITSEPIYETVKTTVTSNCEIKK